MDQYNNTSGGEGPHHSGGGGSPLMGESIPRKKNGNGNGNGRGLQAVYDVPVQVSAVLGRVTMSLAQLLKLGRGAVLELDRRTGETIDIYVNNKFVARGEVIKMDESLGVQITEIVRSERL